MNILKIIDTARGGNKSIWTKIAPDDINYCKRDEGITFIVLKDKRKVKTSESLDSILSKMNGTRSDFETGNIIVLSAGGGHSSFPAILNIVNIARRRPNKIGADEVVFEGGGASVVFDN
ncbi:MAG: hypothetical protein PHH54_06215 [Candidatus Nanoarchaeia archaeon]|nr:hypothetical protein [Candidatus Nanoarchaeia archaeon]MDD5741549.1 hypothetical protein [Candidatus Nanoarchaeia archaeon]